ncbi:hypothetical protein ACE02Z_15245 [Shewanella xiamenensis]|uniref:hypothetical protein n=1 Tax=Shewanella xiamenensis TaxID=332186 RepID=UPI00313ACC7A
MSEQPESIKLKRITIKTESGSRWFDDPRKLQAWCREQPELYSFLDLSGLCINPYLFAKI